MKTVLVLLILSMTFFSCATAGDAAVATAPLEADVVEAAVIPAWADLDTSTGNLLETLPEDRWYGVACDYGSEVEWSGPADGVLEVDFFLAALPGPNQWPWVEVVSMIDQALDGTQGIKITYEHDNPFILKFSQTDFGPDGDNSYAHYQFTLPETKNGPETVYVSVEDFEQPGWATPASEAIPLKLENVNAVYLVPGNNYGEGSFFRLTHLELFGISMN
ncbi:hypothetical protein [Spirochaeta dissipatitropha]